MRYRIIVDGDPIAYSAGAAGETREHRMIFEHPKGATEMLVLQEDPRAAIKELLEDGWELIDRELLITPKDWEFVAMLTRTVVRGIRNHCANRLGVEPEEADLEIVLSGKANYRNDVATVTPYKGSRVGKLKPHWYAGIRDYLLTEYNADLTDGHEADDEVSIRMVEAATWGDRTILATIDKDLDQIVGSHYDYKKHVFYEVDADEARHLLYKQILSGDPVDDIPGCMGIGAGKSEKYMEEWEEEYEEGNFQIPLEQFLWSRIVYMYGKNGVKGAPCGHWTNEGAELLAIETARLVYLQQRPGELWEPPVRLFPC